MKKAHNSATIIRNIARYTLSVLWILVVIFAILSEPEDGGRMNNIIKENPYILPWMILLGLIIIAWFSEFIGGISISLFGIALFYIFNFREPDLFSVGSTLAYIIILLGSSLLFSWSLREDRD